MIDEMTASERRIFVAQQREHSAVHASVARANLRHTLMTNPPPIEDRDARSKREAEEKRRRIEAEDRRRAALVERGVREQRAHELALARAANAGNGNAAVTAVAEITAVLPEISKAFNGLISRIEAIERKLDKVEVKSEDCNRRVEFNATHLREADARTQRDCKEMIDGLKAELNILRIENRILRVEMQRRRPDSVTQHIVHHQG